MGRLSGLAQRKAMEEPPVVEPDLDPGTSTPKIPPLRLHLSRAQPQDPALDIAQPSTLAHKRGLALEPPIRALGIGNLARHRPAPLKGP